VHVQGKCKMHEPVRAPDPPGTLLSSTVDECKDHAGTFKWGSACLSRDGEFICGGAIVKDRHIVHLWQARGSHIAAVLEGPQTSVISCKWHPDASRCATGSASSVWVGASLSGSIYGAT
jgi:WD40 repeat protein